MIETIRPKESPQQEMERFEKEIRELKGKLKPSSYVVLDGKLVALQPNCGSARILMDALLEEYPDTGNPTRKALDLISAGFFINVLEIPDGEDVGFEPPGASAAEQLVAANTGNEVAVEISELAGPVKDDIDELLGIDLGDAPAANHKDPGRAFRAKMDTIHHEDFDVFTKDTTPPPGPLPVEVDAPLSARRRPLTTGFGTTGSRGASSAGYTDPDRMPTLHGEDITGHLVQKMKSGVPIGEEIETAAEDEDGERVTQLDLSVESTPAGGKKK
jgi:hypothetical protein